MFDHKRVNAAVKIKIAIDRILSRKRAVELRQDLTRLKADMTNEELNEYNKRVQ